MCIVLKLSQKYFNLFWSIRFANRKLADQMLFQCPDFYKASEDKVVHAAIVTEVRREGVMKKVGYRNATAS